MTDLYEQYRSRTAAELGLAGNHPDAIQKHLDAYEAAVAHRLAERIRAYRGALNGKEWHDFAADLIDPESVE